MTRNVQRDRFLIQRHATANVQEKCYAIDLKSSMKLHAGVSVITMEHVRLHTSSILGTASVPAQGSSIVPMARHSVIKHVTVPASGRKTAQPPTYLMRILAGVHAPIRLMNAPIQLTYSIQRLANVNAQGSFGAIMGKCLTLPHVDVSAQQSQNLIAVHHTSIMTTIVSANAHINRQKAALMDRFGTAASVHVNVQKQ